MLDDREGARLVPRHVSPSGLQSRGFCACVRDTRQLSAVGAGRVPRHVAAVASRANAKKNTRDARLGPDFLSAATGPSASFSKTTSTDRQRCLFSPSLR